MSYQRLFDPPSQDDLEYLPDPMGRLDMGSYVEKPETMPEPGWETARADWMNGAPLGEIFGDSLFDLQAGVGAEQPNRRGDVFKLQALLHREGFLDSAATEGPTGYWGGRDDYALRNFQKENGLSIDGFAEPAGETISTIKGFYKPLPGIRTMEKRASDPDPVLRPIGLGGDRPVKPTLLSSDPSRYAARDAVAVGPDTQEPQRVLPVGTQYAQARQPGIANDLSSEAPMKLTVEHASPPPKPAAKPPVPGQGWVLDDAGQQAVRDLEQANKALPAKDKKYLSPDGVEEGAPQQQCVVLVQKLLPGIGRAKTWQEGAKIKAEGDPPLKAGTAIATFKDGKYENKNTGNHAAIFQRYGEQGGQQGIYVLDQSKGRPPAERFIRFNDKAPSASNNAGAFSVIQRRGK